MHGSRKQYDKIILMDSDSRCTPSCLLCIKFNTYDQCFSGKTDFIFNVVVDLIVSCRPLQVQKEASQFGKVEHQPDMQTYKSNKL